ncbi:MAG: hypothetical protein WBP44_07460 [Gammaproteobacteria bacterium]
MQRSTHSTLHTLWLPLLLVFVFGVGPGYSLCRAEDDYQEIALQSGYLPDSSENDASTGACVPSGNARLFQSAALYFAQRLSAVTASDAYPSSILHGPPVPVSGA